MKPRKLIILNLALLLLLSGMLMAQAGGPSPMPNRVSANSGQAEGGNYRLSVSPGLAEGGNYRLNGSAWPTGSLSSGENYQLLVPRATSLTGSGCCCMYLPCVMKAN